MILIIFIFATCYAEEIPPRGEFLSGTLITALASWLCGSFPVSFFLPSLFLLLCFYFLPKVSFIVRTNVCWQLQTPLINPLAYELASASSVRHLESRKDCQMVSQICLVICLMTNGADPMAGFSDVVDTSA